MKLKLKDDLPPGQYELMEFPRFGLTKFAGRFPDRPNEHSILIKAGINQLNWLADQPARLQRINQRCDFHCVTTWSKRGLNWSGFRFSVFYENIVVPLLQPESHTKYVIFRCQDGFRARLLLTNVLAPDVLLADRLENAPLSIAHGAPLRLIAPAQYGYKSAKHIKVIEFCQDDRAYTAPLFEFMDHPRARVEHEERGKFLPGPIFRWLYRPLVNPVRRKFRIALTNHRTTS